MLLNYLYIAYCVNDTSPNEHGVAGFFIILRKRKFGALRANLEIKDPSSIILLLLIHNVCRQGNPGNRLSEVNSL